MKTFHFQKTFLAVMACVGLMLSTLTVAAQNSTDSPAPPLAYGVPQILQLAQAKVTDDVIVAYIHNSGNSYGLDADQIIYLRQQGISDKVLTTMLTQPKPAPASAQVAAPDNSSTAPVPVAYTQPTPAPAYIQPASSSVYLIPNNQIYYSTWYPYFYPYVSFSYVWGGGCRNGCYCRGGYHGGNFCYSGGGYHGGVAYASHGASYHGGGYASVGVSYHGGGMMHR